MALRAKNPIIQNRKRARTPSSIKYIKQHHQSYHKKPKSQHDHLPVSGKLSNGTSLEADQAPENKPEPVKGLSVEPVVRSSASGHSEQAEGGALESTAIKSENYVGRHSFASSAASALDLFLAKPLRFLPATRLTCDDELSVVGNMKVLHSLVSDHQLRREKTSKLSAEWLAVQRGKPSGLHNVHNFCYRRSVLQTFLHLPVFSSWLRNHIPSLHSKQKQSPDKRCVACDLKQLSEAVWSRHPAVNVSLKQLDLAVRQSGSHAAYPWTANSSQADAHEFLCWLVDILEQRYNAPPLVIEGIFKLRILSQWICQDCAEVHTSTPQDETGLSLQLKQPADAKQLDQYIGAYFHDTVSDARCANLNCRSKRDRTRLRTIGAAPRVLFVQLQRFESHYDARTRQFRTNKISKDVRFSQELDLSAYAHDTSLQRQKALKYRLSSVISHAGTLRSGHYITYAEGPKGILRKFDDEYVSSSDPAEMMRSQGSFVPYILTYTSCEPTMAKL